MRQGVIVFVLVLALVVGACAGQAGPPLRIPSSADAATAISIPGLGPCESESDASAGKTIDPGRPVVVLVHGCKSSAGRFKTPKEFATFIQSELESWGPVLRKSGIKLE